MDPLGCTTRRPWKALRSRAAGGRATEGAGYPAARVGLGLSQRGRRNNRNCRPSRCFALAAADDVEDEEATHGAVLAPLKKDAGDFPSLGMAGAPWRGAAQRAALDASPAAPWRSWQRGVQAGQRRRRELLPPPCACVHARCAQERGIKQERPCAAVQLHAPAGSNRMCARPSLSPLQPR